MKQPKNISTTSTQRQQERIERLKIRMDAATTSEVIRRSLELHDRLLSADEVWIVIDGEKQRIFIP